MGTPAALAAAAMAPTTRSRSATGKPSSMTKPAERAKGWAPHAARSLTVPLTARSPRHPPAKKIGETTKESVVKATGRPATLTTAPSLSGASSGLAKASRKTGLDQGVGRFSARAVGEVDHRVAESPLFSAGPRLPGGHDRALARGRSRLTRPKL